MLTRSLLPLLLLPGGVSAAQQTSRKPQNQPAPPSAKTPAPSVPAQAVPKPAAPKSPAGSRMLYGANVVWGDSGGGNNWDKNRGAKAAELVALMKAAGVTNTRVGISWAEVERARGKYDWSEPDKFLRYVKSQGFVLTCVVAGIPDWAGDNSSAARALFAAKGVPHLRGVMAPDPKFYADFARFAQELGKRYKDIIQRWEFWNEPDGMGMPIVARDASGRPADIRYGGDPAVYTKLLSLFSENIKRAHPSCLVSVGGLATPRTDFLKGIYANGGQKSFDAVALHPYNPSGPLDFAWIDACRKLLEQRGDAKKKFWLTEWGWSAYPGTPEGLTEGHQARLIRESFAAMRKRPYIEQASYHTLNDWRADEKEPLSLMSMGLSARDLKPRPALMAFQAEARNRPLAARRARRLSLVATLPPKMVDSAASLDMETARIQGAMAKTWLGVSFPSLAELDTQMPFLKEAGASFARLNPFASREVFTLAPDGAPVVRWESADALLEQVAGAGGQIILALTPPVGLSAEKWSVFIAEAAQRYGKEPRFGVVRWEMGIPQRTFGETDNLMRSYAPAFARAVRKAIPTRPVGFHLLVGDPMVGIETLANACTEASVTFDSFSWRASAEPDQLAQSLRRLRGALAAFPGLKGTYLLPEFSRFASPAQVAAAALRLRDFTPSGEPNSSLGFMTGPDAFTPPKAKSSAPDEFQEGEGDRIGTTLALLNRVSGSRLQAESDSSAVRALATRGTGGFAMLVWNESRQREQAANVRLRDLPSEARRGLRVERFMSSEASEKAKKPVAVMDVRNSAGGSLEMPMVLRPGDVTLLTCGFRRAPPPLDITLSSPRFLWKGGESPELLVTVRNISTRLQPLAVELTASLPGMIPASLAKTKAETLSPGKSYALRYRLLAPFVMQTTDATVQVKIGTDSRASLALRIAASLSAELETPRLDLETSGQAAAARVRVTNQGKSPQTITLRAATRSGLARALIPGGGKSVAMEVMVEAPERDPGLYEIPLTIESESGALATFPVLVGVPVISPYAKIKPEIDADLREWTHAVPIGMGREEQVRLKEWRGPNDLSALVYTAWDAQYLYIACAARDETPGMAYPAAELWRGDSVQFAISTHRGANGQGGYGSGDHEFGIALVEEKPLVYRFFGEEGKSGALLETPVAVKRVGPVTFYEAAIPWKELAPLRPDSGAVFGFSILVNDDDGRGRGYIEWGGGIGDAKRPGRFPPLRLIK